jgi:FkbM family methyltransferase
LVVVENKVPLKRLVKEAVWHFIARNRRTPAVKLLHKLERFVHYGYVNVGVDIKTNGEYQLISRLSEARPRVAFDVGANRGDWLVEALRLWPDCRFHAFEVAPETCSQLADRISMSAYDSRVVLNACGLGNIDGTMEMNYVPDYPNLTTALELTGSLRHNNYESVSFLARLVTADRYMREHRIDAIDFAKIDVEGGEYQVLEGLRDCVNREKVHCIQFEYSPFAITTKFLLTDFYSLLSEKYWIGKVYPGYVEFTDYDWRMEDFEVSNYCAVSKARPDLRDLVS